MWRSRGEQGAVRGRLEHGRRAARGRGGWQVLGAALLLCSASHAQVLYDDTTHWRALARTRGYAGLEAFRQGDYQNARARLEEAYALLPAPSLGLWLARAHAQLGALSEAAALYDGVARSAPQDEEPQVQAAARLTAREELAALLPRLSSLRVAAPATSEGTVSVLLDGVSIEGLGARWPIDPGQHLLSVRWGAARANGVLQIGEGEHHAARVSLAPGSAGGAPAVLLDVARVTNEGPLEARELDVKRGVPLASDVDHKAVTTLADEGFAAFQRHDLVRAGDRLREAFQLYPLPAYALFAARAASKRGQLMEAASLYRKAARAPRIQGEAQDSYRADAELELRQVLGHRLPLLRILLVDVLRADVELTLDGAPLESSAIGEEWAIDPGMHTLSARHGSETSNVVLTLTEGERRDVILEFQSEDVTAQVQDESRATSPGQD